MSTGLEVYFSIREKCSVKPFVATEEAACNVINGQLHCG